jgi:beta-lactamase regulating signal transducer with metallopeptidase domain
MSYADTLDLVVRSLGWALLHSLWQGAVVGGVVALLLSTLRAKSPQVRYVVACLGLAAMIAAWVGTAVSVNRALAPSVAARALRVAVEPTIELGPAGPDDPTPAIRVFDSRESLDRVGPPVPWAQRIEQWSWLLVPLWLVGVGLLSARLAVSWLGVTRLRRARQRPVPDAIAARMEVLVSRLRIRRAVRIVQSAAVQVPLVVGWLRPVVMLPASALTGLSPAQLEAVIAHELAHVRRHDYLLNVLQSVAEVLLYYHPACWWISRRIRVEREHCCDDIAVALCGDGVTYATALADLESRRRDAALALAASDGPLLQRVRRVIAIADEVHREPDWAGSLAPIALMVVLVVGAQAVGRAALADATQAPVPTNGRSIPATEVVLQGRVVEANSARPVAGATVQAMGTEGAAETRTDDDGRYELRGLKAGSYTVFVKARGFVETYYGKSSNAIMDFGSRVTAAGGRVTSGLDVRLQSAASISGRITDAKGRPLAGVEVELVREQASGAVAPGAGGFAQTIEDGTYRMPDIGPGDYFVRAYTSRNMRPADGPAHAFAPTFYPGVADVGGAQRLRLYPGQELLDVDFALATSRSLRVSGRLMDPNGGLVSGLSVMLHPMAPSGLPGGELRVPVDAEGAFEIADVVPGDYMLNVLDPRRTMRWVSAGKFLSVSEDVLDLDLRAMLGATVEGRVVRDVAATGTLDLKAVHVGFDARIEGQRGGVTGSTFPVGEDGAFSLESPGGLVRFNVNRLPPGWMVRSVTLDGSDLDGPLDFGSGKRHVEIVLTDRMSGVSGVVVDRNGRPLTNYIVVVFPPDAARWHQGSRFILSAWSDNAGRFRLEGVPAGQYLAIAVPALPLGSWGDAAVLEKLQGSAEQIRVGEGQQLTVSIRASPTPEGLGASLTDRVQHMVVALRSAASRLRETSPR